MTLRHPRAQGFALLWALAPLCWTSSCAREKGSPPAASAQRQSPVESVDTIRRSPGPTPARPRVIWLGLDGLDFELLDRLAAAGTMPTWKRLAAEGYTARLVSDYPLISPVLWTTAATGVPPDVHRVLDFQEVDPSSGRKRPISGLSRRAPAVWNLASADGRRVGVVGWWATHPAEQIDGFFVSDRLSPLLFSEASRSGATFPAALAEGLDPVIERDGRVIAEDLLPYLGVPAAEIASALASGAGMKHPITALARVLAATRVTQRTARDLHDQHRPDLTAVYFAGTDEVGHIFAPYIPPLDCPGIMDSDRAKYGRVVDVYYAAIDRILGQWMRRADEGGAVLIVHSDHGFKWGGDRPCGFASGNWSTAAFWHRPEGVLALRGTGVRRGMPRGTAHLADIAPTVLSLLDVAGDRRMTGAALTSAFERPLRTARADRSTLAVARVAGRPASEAEASGFAEKLRALGYISAGEPATLAPSGGSYPGLTEGAWNNLGTYELMTRRNFAAAKAAFEESLRLRPDYYSPMFNLAVLHRDQGDARQAEEWLLRAGKVVPGDPAPALIAWAREWVKRGNAAAARSLLAKAATSFPHSEPIGRARASLLHENKDCRGASAALARFEASTSNPDLLNDLALYETCLVHREAVERLLSRSLALKPDQPAVKQALEAVRRAGR